MNVVMTWLLFLTVLTECEIPRSAAQAAAAIAREGAYGDLQVRQICLDHVNFEFEEDILSWNGGPITLVQCRDHPAIARWVCMKYIRWCDDNFKQTFRRSMTWEERARCWVGGPGGWHKSATLPYLQKFREKRDIILKAAAEDRRT